MDNLERDGRHHPQVSHILPPTGASREGSGNARRAWEGRSLRKPRQNLILAWEREAFHNIIPGFHLDGFF